MKCPDCGQVVGAPEWGAKQHIMWRNQHGQKVRIFCDACGAWNDVIQRDGKRDAVTQRRPPTIAVT